MKKSETVNESRVAFPSYSNNEAYSRAVAAAFCAQLNPTFDELSDIKCAVSEAVTNAIVHGYREKIGEITMIMKMTADRVVRIEVRDKGCGIPDVECAMQPLFTTCPGDERSGMGFTIIENFMDSLRVVSSVGRGTRVIMTKKLSLLPRSR